jgi:hypothetical protein
MIHNKTVGLLAAVGLLFFNSGPPIHAADSISTGDLGENVITSAGAYTWSPTIIAPSVVLPATLDVIYGLWEDPAVTIHAFVNGTEVGAVLGDVGYGFPGPSSNSFDITGLLVDGVNTIVVSGLGESSGAYILGGITVNYNLPAQTNEPPTNSVSSLPSRRGLLHYLTRTPLGLPGSTVTGSVRLQSSEQPKSSLQRFDLDAIGLDPATEYILVIATREETNAVQTVTSDGKGRLAISYLAKGQGDDITKKPFPSGFALLTDIRSLSLQSGSEVVAGALINTSPEFEYLVKRPLTQGDTNGTPAGSMSFKADASEVNFQLRAEGLTAGQTYRLALNGAVAATVSADALGQIVIEGWPAGAPAVLDLRALSLLDAANVIVLGTTLPK